MKMTNIVNEIVSEKMTVNKVSAKDYAKLVAAAYDAAPEHDPNALPHWKALNESNYKLWRRLLSKVNVVFTSENPPRKDTIRIAGKDHPLIHNGDPYENQPEMRQDVKENNRIMIMIDHSEHPVFTVEDNIVFRTVHDYIVHILGNKPFGLFGELQSYNLHAKMVPVAARPAIFTEVVGQVCYHSIHGKFPVQKVATLDGFDYLRVGDVSPEAIKRYGNEVN
jgi:hypothetical protein